MDFIEGLPISDHCCVIVVVVDRHTKYAQFLPPYVLIMLKPLLSYFWIMW
jgi:hypothetical protein